MKKLFANGVSDEAIIMALVVAAFFPWLPSFVLLACIAGFIFVYKRTRKMVFDKTALALLPFLPLAVVPSVIHKNFFGILSGFGIVLVFLLFLYLSKAVTAAIAEKAYNAVCVLSIVAGVYAVIEKIVYVIKPELSYGSIVLPSNDDLRTASLFGNPNLYSSVICFAVIIAVNMLLDKKGDFKFYTVTIAVNLVGMLLCGSLMGMMELFVGVLMLFLLKRQWKILAGFGVLCAVAAGAILAVPSLLPRFSSAGHSTELRMRIWKLSLIMFEEAPLFGRGILSYMKFSPDYVDADLDFAVKVTTNAHNLLIDGLLSFGIIGMAALIFYLIMGAFPVLRGYFKCKERSRCALAIAAMVGALVHGIFDVTIMWPQVAIIFLIMVAAGYAQDSTTESKVTVPQT